MGAVCIEGPKWCGKTWTALNHANSTFDLSDPTRNFQNKTLAETEVESALRGDSPHHIDEWQLSLVIPAKALWFGHTIDTLDGLVIGANFYKCGDKLPEPHFVSWNAIEPMCLTDAGMVDVGFNLLLLSDEHP